MNNYKIKIIKDTPFNLEGDELSIVGFRGKYGYICTSDVSDEDLINYLKNYDSNTSLTQTSKYRVSDWFQVIEEPKFKIGDWVWDEER